MKPDRVLINTDGDARPAKEGEYHYIVFIRDDGWSLGASKALAEIAYSMWRDNWIKFAKDGFIYPISSYGKSLAESMS